MSGTTAMINSTNAPYKGGIMRPESLTLARRDAPYNEQVLRFVLLAEMLRDSGLCNADIRVCLSKCVKSLPGKARDQLHMHFPNTSKLNNKDFNMSISQLGADGNLPDKYIDDATHAARLRLAEDPKWFYGENG